MKRLKYTGLITVILVTTFNSQAQNQILNHFRNFVWGSSPELVKKGESAELLQTSEGFGEYVLTYADEFAGLQVRLDYIFTDKLLSSGTYTYKPSDNFRKFFIHFFADLQKIEGSPNFHAGPDINQNNFWIKDGDYGMFKGPEY